MSQTEERSALIPTSGNPPPPVKSPRPLKRCRTNNISSAETPPDHFCKVSPSKPARARSNLLTLTSTHAPSDSDEDVPSVSLAFPLPFQAITLPNLPNPSAHALPRSSPSAPASPIAPRTRSQPLQPEIADNVTAARKDTIAATAAAPIQLPDDFDYPSPPPSSSESAQEGNEPNTNSNLDTPITTNKPYHGGDESKIESSVFQRRKRVTDSFEPLVNSQDSVYFSFKQSKRAVEGPARPVTPEAGKESGQPENDQDSLVGLHVVQRRYYTAAFEYVVEEVLKRYQDVLRANDLEVASFFRNEISQNALALFVRMYRRKPIWYRVIDLKKSYSKDIDVEKAILELGENSLLISSHYAAKNPHKAVRVLLASEVLSTCDADQIRTICGAVPDGHKLRKQKVDNVRPILRKMLLDDATHSKGQRKLRQTTLTGLSGAEHLATAVLQITGHCVRIPDHVLISLKRIHFLFFLEDGHDSPNVILADTGKATFPAYRCAPKGKVFNTIQAFDDYEAATAFEERLNKALENRDYQKAADLGAIAELEVREYLAARARRSDVPPAQQMRRSASSTCRAQHDSIRELPKRALDHAEASRQLCHPFFRRYTAQWVYVRSAWHSVNALERLGEYENAVERIRLLLSTRLIPRRRGKCLNRLTINLVAHLGRLGEALDVILEALAPSGERLHLGDRLGLANRGINIHRKLATADAEEKAKNVTTSKTRRKKAAAANVIASRPAVLVETLSSTQTKIRFRKIQGKSVQVSGRERRIKSAQRMMDSWAAFKGEESKNSLNNESKQDSSVLGKSIFISRGTDHELVSVEGYCLEWYLGKEGWSGVHDEGASIRFLYTLLFWDCAVFAAVEDVFQTPYQDRPLDLFTEAYYPSRKEGVDLQLKNLRNMKGEDLRDSVRELYEKHENTRAVGCAWQTFCAEDLSHIAAGIGGPVLAHCCKLLSEDYSYWGGGLPDLMLWRTEAIPSEEVFDAKFVEVKSARDSLSERQKAWLIELRMQGADCEVCKVVERVTNQNAAELRESTLDAVALSAIDNAKS